MSKKKPKRTKDQLEADYVEYVKLSWKLLEWKIAYYMPEKVHRSRIKDLTIEDDYYDHKERRYLTLCRRLGFRNTIVHKRYPGYRDVGTKHAMVEVDENRPSVQLVLSKLQKRSGK